MKSDDSSETKRKGSEMEKMLSVEMIAKQFNVSPRTVIRLVRDKEIRALRVGRQWRFKKGWIDEWVAKNTTQINEDSA